MISWDK